LSPAGRAVRAVPRPRRRPPIAVDGDVQRSDLKPAFETRRAPSTTARKFGPSFRSRGHGGARGDQGPKRTSGPGVRPGTKFRAAVLGSRPALACVMVLAAAGESPGGGVRNFDGGFVRGVLSAHGTNTGHQHTDRHHAEVRVVPRTSS